MELEEERGSTLPSNRLKEEISTFHSMTPFNYMLHVHNDTGRLVKRGFTDRELSVGDTRNDLLSGGAWIDRASKDNVYVVYDIDFIRNLYPPVAPKDPSDTVLSIWSLVGHEWGHMEGEKKRKKFRDETLDETYANERMRDFMKKRGFSDEEIAKGYGKYYEIFYRGRTRDGYLGIVAKDGNGTMTDLDESWAGTDLNKCKELDLDGSCKLPISKGM